MLMLDVYLRWHHFATEALDYPVHNAITLDNIDRVVVAGMGGSGVVGDMLASIASDFSDLDIHVSKDFYIPKRLLTPNTFVIAISYSGNTIETIAAVTSCLEQGIKVGIVTSGGKLVEIAKSRFLPYVIVRGGLMPRLALPAMLIASAKLLAGCGLEPVPIDILKQSIAVLKQTDNAMNTAKYLSELLYRSSMPTIIASRRYWALALRFKNELNENSKMPAKVEVLPELFHNDIVGYEGVSRRDVAILIDSDIEYENRLIKFYNDYLQSRGMEAFILKLSGNIIERFMLGSLIAGIASVYTATRKGVDPSTTHSTDLYKNFVKGLEKEVLDYHRTS
uniref:SIS domain-containing protein n=1 Tax=Ignisphaera aggregans TaxID=334771 RepID=A0A7C2Z101_9CREN